MKTVQISQVDALFANGSYPVEMLFFYREGFSARKLRRALRQLSSIFWPVFGEYKDGVIVVDRYREENCFDEGTVGREIDRSELEGAGRRYFPLRPSAARETLLPESDPVQKRPRPRP